MSLPLPPPEFVDAPARCFVGLSERFTMQTRDRIPALYERFFQAQICPEHAQCGALYGLSYNASPEGLDYAVAVEVGGNGTVPEGACRLATPAGRYAVFRHRGPVMEIPQMLDAILSRWLPEAEVDQREGAVFERYPEDPDCDGADGGDMVMRYEIWLPVTG